MPRCIFAFVITVQYYCEIFEVLHEIFIFGRTEVLRRILFWISAVQSLQK